MVYKRVHVRDHERSHPKRGDKTVHVRNYDRNQEVNPEQKGRMNSIMAGKPPAGTSDDSYPIKFQPMGYEVLDWDEVEHGDKEDRKRIEDMAAKNLDLGTIRIVAIGGVVDDIQNLPSGWDWEILDHDDQYEEGEALRDYKRKASSKPDPFTVRVVISGGLVDEVKNLPKNGWKGRKLISTGVQDMGGANDYLKGDRVIGKRGAPGGNADGFGPGTVLYATVSTVTVQHDGGRIDTYPKQWVKRHQKEECR